MSGGSRHRSAAAHSYCSPANVTVVPDRQSAVLDEGLTIGIEEDVAIPALRKCLLESGRKRFQRVGFISSSVIVEHRLIMPLGNELVDATLLLDHSHDLENPVGIFVEAPLLKIVKPQARQKVDCADRENRDSRNAPS